MSGHLICMEIHELLKLGLGEFVRGILSDGDLHGFSVGAHTIYIAVCGTITERDQVASFSS